MNITEINRYRECREAETKLEIEKTTLRWAAAERHDDFFGGEDALFSLYNKDKQSFVALHIGQLSAAHHMMQGLMLAPRSDTFGAVKIEWPYSHFSVKKRTIQTPEAGDFVAEARVWRDKRITSANTNLSLAYLHSQGDDPNFPNFNRTENIISTQADELTFDRHQYISWYDPVRAACLRETVAAVCAQVGVEVIEV